jgi:hypothetical protein
LLTFLNINNLKWVTFLEIIAKENYTLLDANYSEKKSYTEKEIESLKNAWTDIQDEVFTLENNEESKMLLKKSFERLMLVERIRLIEGDANLLIWLVDKKEIYTISGREDDYYKELQGIYAMIVKHDSRIKIDYFGDIQDNLKIIERVILSLVNEYNTKFKDIEQKVTKITNSLFYNVLQINRITGLQLNAMTMVVAEWIEAKKIAIEMNKPQPNTAEK